MNWVLGQRLSSPWMGTNGYVVRWLGPCRLYHMGPCYTSNGNYIQNGWVLTIGPWEWRIR